MSSYRFVFVATHGAAESACVIEADSDDMACDFGSEFLWESDFPIVEVWRAREMIYRMSKLDPDQPATGAANAVP
jgi:hypothetical protein